jgi:hypothetical protein
MTSTSNGRNGNGIAAQRARKRRVFWLVGSVLAIAIVAYAILIPMSRHAGAVGPALPPAVAIAGAIALVLCLTVGVLVYLRIVDELEYRDNLASFSIGFIFNMSAYVAWTVLHAGGVAPRLDGGLISVASACVAALVYVWLKLKAHLG